MAFSPMVQAEKWVQSPETLKLEFYVLYFILGEHFGKFVSVCKIYCLPKIRMKLNENWFSLREKSGWEHKFPTPTRLNLAFPWSPK